MAEYDEYDLSRIFARIEDELIGSMVRNLKRHEAEEDLLEFNWSQWQAEQLQALEKYKRENKKKYGKEFKSINESIDRILRETFNTGRTNQEQEILRAIQKGFTPSGSGLKGEFFKLNSRKLDALVKATTDDMKKGEVAILRKANDEYRKVIFDAQVYANSGAGTYEKAVDMAMKDFLSAGINCVEYSNGSRHRMEDYCDMAIRTANKRAYLYGEGERRQAWGIATVIVNKRNGACPKCMPFTGKVFIDDVWSGGEAKGAPYPLISSAVAAGLYHPRCRDSHTTYFPGISTQEPKWTKEEIAKVEKQNKEEAWKNYAENQAEKYGRLEKYSIDRENRKAARIKRKAWTRKNEQSDTPEGHSKVFTRARNINSAEILNKMSQSDIIQMQSLEEIKDHFTRRHGVDVLGFEKKDLFDVKATLAGYDDMLKEFPETRMHLREIRYNPHLRDCGNYDDLHKISEVGPHGLRDYGTGIHESTHALDTARSKQRSGSYSEEIVALARKNLGLRINSKEYGKLCYMLSQNMSDIKKPYEIMAFAIETKKGLVENRLAEEIYRLVSGGR